MNTPLSEYKTLIDGLVGIHSSTLAIWARKKGWPKTPENKEFNQSLSQLTSRQREVLAQMIQLAYDGGIFDTLAYLNDDINLRGLRFSRHNVEFAIEPYGTELYWDWQSRCDGEAWPEHQLDDKYK